VRLKIYGWERFTLCLLELRSEAHLLGILNFTIYDSQDSLRAISGIIKEMQLDRDVYKPKQVLSRISNFKIV
jgi:DNA helicase-2/ATP-dependent DNA helicase PcrA